jgi:BirA family biotin operon repressor/biotin-[acetyl-CoA-carboxylase] ligase
MIRDQWLLLADALADGNWHSGEALAVAAGISRAALAKRVERLREMGLEVEARHGLGYRLAAPLERLDETALGFAVAAAARVRVVVQTDSTNRALLDADSADDPQVLLAESQTAGRGRRGRSWHSPFGANLYLSAAWSLPAWPPRLTTLPLAVGVAVAEAVGEAAGVAVQRKGPTDLYAQGRKLGGVLIEPRGESGGSCRVIVGVGLNVSMSAQQAGTIDQPWVSLDTLRAEQGLPRTPRNALAAAVIRQLLAMMRRFAADGFASFADRWSALDLVRDRAVTVSGAQPLEGLARGIDADGALRVECGGRIERVHAGDVSLRLAPR